MVKVFISQPMNGISDEEILEERAKATELLTEYFKKEYNEEVTIASSFFTNDNVPGGIPEDANGIWYLGRSLQLLYDCDYIYFIDGYENARGCLVEEYVAYRYDITRLYKHSMETIINQSH